MGTCAKKIFFYIFLRFVWVRTRMLVAIDTANRNGKIENETVNPSALPVNEANPEKKKKVSSEFDLRQTVPPEQK